jgi:hypothetical protein
MDWLSALISGAFTVVVAGVTYRMTLSAAKERATADLELVQRRIAADVDLALKRAAVDEKLALLKVDLDRGIAERREALDLRLQRIRSDFDRERISAEQRQANRQPFLLKQLELCFEASDIAARLATEIDPDEWERARLSFWRLYWGILSIVEDVSVERAMMTLGNAVPREKVEQPELPMISLRTPSYKLAHAARDLMRTNWDVSLPVLPGES